jgi:MATE family multidrug resistance protein
LVDTAFIARVGTAELAGLGAGTAAISAALWVFNFLGIGTQTEVSKSLGAENYSRAGQIVSSAFCIATVLGLILATSLLPLCVSIASAMGTEGKAQQSASDYLYLRLLGAPAVLLMAAGFGALRGLQKPSVPLRIALFVNFINLILDPLLIFGFGPIPSQGVSGAALASTVSQWLGAFATLVATRQNLVLTATPSLSHIRALLKIGFDVTARSGALLLFLLLATRAANRLGNETGAAHQAIRSIWMFSAFLLDAYSHAAQALIGFFLGRREIRAARQVVKVACIWAASTGIVMCGAFILSQDTFIWLFVSKEAENAFRSAWILASLQMPVNALVFATDGIHWGSGDYAYLRTGMLVALMAGGLAIHLFGGISLLAIWWITGGWTVIRAAFGLFRIWPGSSDGPLGRP